MLKMSVAVTLRLGSRATLRQYSISSAKIINIRDDGSNSIEAKSSIINDDKERAGLVAAAFSALRAPDSEDQKKPEPNTVRVSKVQHMESRIISAKDINSLLVVAENPVVSRRHALKMVSILSDWSSENKVKISDFEKDPRFLKLCRILARSSSTQSSSLTVPEDLSTVLGVTGDDEAARLIANLSLQQMIKVMKALHTKARRSTPILRALAHNIIKMPDLIDLKKSSDLLFLMAGLNFPDPLLLDRICGDIIQSLQTNKDKTSVVTSSMVSLGLLKYRHEACLDACAQWITQHLDITPVSNLASFAVTLATLDYVPFNSDKMFEVILSIKEEDLIKPTAWLDLVFALLTLNKATEQHLNSTLRPEFMDKLLTLGEIAVPSRRKLMTIDGYVSVALPSYAGARLAPDIAVGVPVVYNKDKTVYVQGVMDTIKNLISSDNFIRTHCNSDMGFLYDCEFALDSKCHPVPLEKAVNNKNVFRIAVLSLDYHDMCRKSVVPLGVFQLYTRILELKGYKVLQIPFSEFNPKDKLLTRVQYVEKRLKDIVSRKPEHN